MKKTCKFCGKEFEASSNRQIYCNGPHYRTCPICGEQYEETHQENLKKPPRACSYKCRAAKTKQTSLSRYGCTSPGNNESARAKARATCLSNTGHEYAMQSPEVRAKSRITILQKYGVDNVSKSKQITDKRMSTNRERYGNILPFNLQSSYEYREEDISHIKKARAADKINELCEFLTTSGVQFERNKQVENLQYDIYIPDINTVVEIDATSNQTLPKYYHKNKTRIAKRSGLQCIHIFDWDNYNVLKQNLVPKTSLNANTMTVYQLNVAAANEFLSENHYAGTRRNQIFCLGLVKDGIIYQVMTFGKPTYSKSHYIQIYRTCTRCGFDIPGGLDKLSDTASSYGLYKIVAYADLAKTCGVEYENIGMNKIRETPPRLIWSKGDEYISSAMLSRNRYGIQSEDELIQSGWRPVYDCGQAVYEFE